MAELTAEQYNELVKKHGKITAITVDVDGGKIDFAFKKLTKMQLSAVIHTTQQDVVEGTDLLLRETMVFGDEKYLDDIDIFTALMKEANQFTSSAVTTLKNFLPKPNLTKAVAK